MPMAGTIRKRNWTTRKGETKSAWAVNYPDRSGKWRQKSFATQKAARAYLLRAQTEVRDGIHVYDKDSITVAEAGELWLASGAANGLERSSLRTSRVHLDRINRSLGGMRLANLSPPRIEAWRDELLRAVGRGTYAVAVLISLKALLSDAQRRGLIVHNPATPTRIKLGTREQERLAPGIGIPTVAEISAVLEAVPRQWYPLLVVAAYTGMRASELRGLQWDAVDLQRRVIHVRQRADYLSILGAPKSAAGRRDIPLSGAVLNVLREWRIAYPYGSAGPVFPSLGRRNAGGILSHSPVWKAFRAAQRAAGVTDAAGRPKYHFHALRHFFASVGIAAGFAPKRLQEIMGHSSIMMTFDRYGHLFPNPEDDYARLATIERMITGKNDS
jgi:integrase